MYLKASCIPAHHPLVYALQAERAGPLGQRLEDGRPEGQNPRSRGVVLQMFLKACDRIVDQSSDSIFRPRVFSACSRDYAGSFRHPFPVMLTGVQAFLFNGRRGGRTL